VATGHCKNPDNGRSTSFGRLIHAAQQIRIDLVAIGGAGMTVHQAFGGRYAKPLNSKTGEDVS
jgi:hypothetical protein